MNGMDIRVTKQQKSSNTVWHNATVTRERRETQNGHRGIIVWFTGLSGSGKSTLAHTAEESLHHEGCRTFVFDGDNVRHGLCSDLAFTERDRAENIRRVGEMVKLFVEAGMIVLTAFISPSRREREHVRSMVPSGDFLEVFCKCSLETCERRDVKGLYKRARSGEIPNFTGISSPYEPPLDPDLEVVTDGSVPLARCAEQVIALLRERDVFAQRLAGLSRHAIRGS